MSRLERALRRSYAGNSLQVGCELDVRVAGAGQQRLNRIRLSVADLKRDEAAGVQHGVRLRNEPSIYVEPIVTGKERKRGLVIADFDGK